MKTKIWAILFIASLLFLSGLVSANTVNIVNVNTASATELADVINGVGMKTAQEIVRYREQNGPFRTVDELVNIKGIGPVTIDKNRRHLTTGDNTGKHAKK